MEIKKYTLEDKAEFEKVVDFFEMQKKNGIIIKPSIFKFRPAFSKPDESFLFAQNPVNQAILGILSYSVVLPNSKGKLREDVCIFPLSNSALEYRFNGKFAWINSLESFPARQGVGTQLVSEIKSPLDFSGIYTIPAYAARDFYTKNYFVAVDHLCNQQGVISMLWRRDGFYL